MIGLLMTRSATCDLLTRRRGPIPSVLVHVASVTYDAMTLTRVYIRRAQVSRGSQTALWSSVNRRQGFRCRDQRRRHVDGVAEAGGFLRQTAAPCLRRAAAWRALRYGGSALLLPH